MALFSLAGAAGAAACEDYASGDVTPLGYHAPGDDIWQNSFVHVIVHDGYAYAENPASGGLEVVKIADPAAPQLMAVVPGIQFVVDLAAWGHHLYVAVPTGVWILDVVDPLHPLLERFYPVETGLYQIDVENGYLYLASLASGLDVALLRHDPTWPLHVGRFPMVTKSVRVFADLAFLRNDEDDRGSLKILDVSDPTDIRELADFGGTGEGLHYGRSIALKGTVAYFASTSCVRAIDVSDPTDPVLLQTVDLPGSPMHVAAAGDALYATTGSLLHVIDTTDAADPVYYGAGAWTFGIGYTIALTGDLAVVAAEVRLALMPLDCLSDPVTGAEVPAAVGAALAVSPNPFNPRTDLSYRLDAPASVEIRIFDARGGLVARLREGPRSAGRHTAAWQGRDRHGRPLASGTYLAILHVDGAPRGDAVKLTLAR